MDKPKKEKKKITVKNAGNGSLNGEMENITYNPSLQENKRNLKVQMKSDTPEFSQFMKKTQGVDFKDGKGTAIKQERKIQYAKPMSGKNTRIIGEDGSIKSEARPGSEEEKEMLRKNEVQQQDSNKRRERGAEVVNYQMGEGKGNKVYDKKLLDKINQEELKEKLEKRKVKVKK